MAFLETARGCAAFGLRIFPVLPPGIAKEPLGKRPAICKWQWLATTEHIQIEKWAAKWPNHNCGICTTDFIALDVDGEEGVESLRTLEATHGQLPRTMKTISSGPARFHLIFRMHPGLQAKSSMGKLGPKLDVKGRRSYVMAPGCSATITLSLERQLEFPFKNLRLGAPLLWSGA